MVLADEAIRKVMPSKCQDVKDAKLSMPSFFKAVYAAKISWTLGTHMYMQ